MLLDLRSLYEQEAVVEEGGDGFDLLVHDQRPKVVYIVGNGHAEFPVTEATGEGTVTEVARAKKEKVARAKPVIESFGESTPVLLHGVEKVIPLDQLPPPPEEFVREIVNAIGKLSNELKAAGRGRVIPPKVRVGGTYKGPGFCAAGRGRITSPARVQVEEWSYVPLPELRADELMLDAELFD